MPKVENLFSHRVTEKMLRNLVLLKDPKPSSSSVALAIRRGAGVRLQGGEEFGWQE